MKKLQGLAIILVVAILVVIIGLTLRLQSNQPATTYPAAGIASA